MEFPHNKRKVVIFSKPSQYSIFSCTIFGMYSSWQRCNPIEWRFILGFLLGQLGLVTGSLGFRWSWTWLDILATKSRNASWRHDKNWLEDVRKKPTLAEIYIELRSKKTTLPFEFRRPNLASPFPFIEQKMATPNLTGVIGRGIILLAAPIKIQVWDWLMHEKCLFLVGHIPLKQKVGRFFWISCNLAYFISQNDQMFVVIRPLTMLIQHVEPLDLQCSWHHRRIHQAVIGMWWPTRAKRSWRSVNRRPGWRHVEMFVGWSN